jgi:hypothetical protein
MNYQSIFQLRFHKYKVEKHQFSSMSFNTITILEKSTNLKYFDNHYYSTTIFLKKIDHKVGHKIVNWRLQNLFTIGFDNYLEKISYHFKFLFIKYGRQHLNKLSSPNSFSFNRIVLSTRLDGHVIYIKFNQYWRYMTLIWFTNYWLRNLWINSSMRLATSYKICTLTFLTIT